MTMTATLTAPVSMPLLPPPTALRPPSGPPVTVRPRKNADLYRQLVDWAGNSYLQIPQADGPLAGVTWDQESWFGYRDGRRTCCIAGAAVLSAGGVPVSPMQVSDGSVQFAGVRMPRTLWGVNVHSAATVVLGLAASESRMLFDPARELHELLRLVPVFDADRFIHPGDLPDSGWYMAPSPSAGVTTRPCEGAW